MPRGRSGDPDRGEERHRRQVALGRRIRERRKARKCRQQDLADQLGLTASAVSKIEKGHRDVGVQDLLEISRFLEFPFERVLGMRDGPSVLPGSRQGGRPRELRAALGMRASRFSKEDVELVKRQLRDASGGVGSGARTESPFVYLGPDLGRGELEKDVPLIESLEAMLQEEWSLKRLLGKFREKRIALLPLGLGDDEGAPPLFKFVQAKGRVEEELWIPVDDLVKKTRCRLVHPEKLAALVLTQASKLDGVRGALEVLQGWGHLGRVLELEGPPDAVLWRDLEARRNQVVKMRSHSLLKAPWDFRWARDPAPCTPIEAGPRLLVHGRRGGRDSVFDLIPVSGSRTGSGALAPVSKRAVYYEARVLALEMSLEFPVVPVLVVLVPDALRRRSARSGEVMPEFVFIELEVPASKWKSASVEEPPGIDEVAVRRVERIAMPTLASLVPGASSGGAADEEEANGLPGMRRKKARTGPGSGG